MSFSVNDWRANGGGVVGKGCVGDDCSPGMSDCGTGRSSIGQIGAPVTRSNTNTKPCFVGCATTSRCRPFWRMVRSFGAVGRS